MINLANFSPQPLDSVIMVDSDVIPSSGTIAEANYI